MQRDGGMSGKPEGQGEGGPLPTVWPCVVGLAIAFALFGIATSLVFTAAGVLGVALGLAGWIQDVRKEAADER